MLVRPRVLLRLRSPALFPRLAFPLHLSSFSSSTPIPPLSTSSSPSPPASPPSNSVPLDSSSPSAPSSSSPPTAFRRIKVATTAASAPPSERQSGLPQSSPSFSPSTASPSTASPSTASPSTASPSTASPLTASPSTASPSTASPSTASPSSASPSSASTVSPASPSALPTSEGAKFYPGLGNKIYQGPLAKSVLTLKLVSLTSCGLTIVSVPFMLFLGDSSLPLTSRAVISAVAVIMGLGSTACMQLITKKYVTSIFQDADKPDTLKVETLNIVARPKWTHMRIEDTNWNVARPFVSFEYKPTGEGFFVHRYLVEDHPLLKVLEQPKKPEHAEAPK